MTMTDFASTYDTSLTYDEMFDEHGQVRAAYESVLNVFNALQLREFDQRGELRDQAFRDQGITFSYSGEERPWPMDLIPRIITAKEWSGIEAGIIQRVSALEMFLEDVYNDGNIIDDGIIPRQVVATSRHFHRNVHGFSPSNGVRIHVAGIDLVRDKSGEFVVLEDNLRCPSGISYVLENRRATSHVFPEIFSSNHIRSVHEYPQKLLNALIASAPRGIDNPTVVVMTPGVHNSAYFEHAFLARQMGVELVEGRDLTIRDNKIYMRTTQAMKRVDVIYRRVDDDYIDPLQFIPHSTLGIAGIINSARSGNVTIANAVGNGVADDKLVYSYMPAIIEYYLGEKPLIKNVDTYRLDDPEARAYALEHRDSLVFKPVDASGGYGLVIGPHATSQELDEVVVNVNADPRGYIAQPVIQLSTSPTYDGSSISPRHVDLRPFVVNDGNTKWAVPGGLTRVALPKGSLVVNSSQGGGSKDTWVLEDALNNSSAVLAQQQQQQQ
ncbi:MAG TPA: circularly permuted type 2 ATP-grasp protein [Acidimicrobiia bacterium]|nr:circularly permuted type 2 ATP-grasp protein [Acidimicrobiia bacterium]